MLRPILQVSARSLLDYLKPCLNTAFLCIQMLSNAYCCLTMGLMNLSYLGGLRVNPSPTKQTLVTILFQAFFCLFPVRITLSTSVSPCARTFGNGTSHLPCGEKQPSFTFLLQCIILAGHTAKQASSQEGTSQLAFLFTLEQMS